MKSIHINCDLGEGNNNEEQIMPFISACNIACGGHAGTVESMHDCVALALEHRVEIGAHPSYPDKENFGRKSVEMSPDKLKQSLVAQILSLKQIAEAEGGRLNHVKPHGALYHKAQTDKDTAWIIIEAIREFNDPLLLYAPPHSVIASLAKGRLELVYEAFADRRYNCDYSLVSRQETGSLIVEKEEVFKQLFQMFFQNTVGCKSGEEIELSANTFCIHSDTPNAVEILKFLHVKMKEKNLKIARAS